MTLNYLVISFTLGVANGAIPSWQRQIPYNDIAHLFHAMYREMWHSFESANRTAGEIIMTKMEKLLEGTRELNHLADVTPEQEFHKKYLQPVRFMILRGRKQWLMITYRDHELKEKYGWSDSEVTRFREIYREVHDLVNEMEDFCKVRHVDLSD